MMKDEMKPNILRPHHHIKKTLAHLWRPETHLPAMDVDVPDAADIDGNSYEEDVDAEKRQHIMLKERQKEA